MQPARKEIKDLEDKIANLENILKIYPAVEVIYDNILYLKDLYKLKHEVKFTQDHEGINVNITQNLNLFVINGLLWDLPILEFCQECGDKHITIFPFKQLLKQNIKDKIYYADLVDKCYLHILEYIKEKSPKYDKRSIPSRYRKLLNFV